MQKPWLSFAATEWRLSRTVICESVRNEDPLAGTVRPCRDVCQQNTLSHVPSCVRSHRYSMFYHPDRTRRQANVVVRNRGQMVRPVSRGLTPVEHST